MSTLLMNGEEMNRAITRIAHEILEKNKGTQDLALVGIRTRGVFLAARLRDKIKEIEKTTLDMGILDITLYRDDLAISKGTPVLQDTDIPFAIDDKKVVLCDDVLFTGRTIRAAIDEALICKCDGQSKTILFNLSGHGHFDMQAYDDYFAGRLADENVESDAVEKSLAELPVIV